jgi:hypothetical protein
MQFLEIGCVASSAHAIVGFSVNIWDLNPYNSFIGAYGGGQAEHKKKGRKRAALSN